MIGDFFGNQGSTYLFGAGSAQFGPDPGSAGGNVGRQKLSENTSPIPRDRVFLNYSLFTDTPLNANGALVNRFTPGFEKTFNNGDMSFEMRLPFAATLDSGFDSNGASDTGELALGDLAIFFKTLLYNTDTVAYSAGLGFSFPTSDGFDVVDAGTGAAQISVNRNAIHALPFLGALWTPNDQLYIQSYLQFDIDLNGNEVAFASGETGRIQDATYMFYSVGAGYWIYKDPCSTGWIRGISPTAELHWNRNLSDTDFFRPGGGANFIGTEEDTIDLIDLILGVNFLVGDSSILTVGYGTPIMGADDQFEGEFRLSLNVLFGAQSRQNVSQF